MAIHAPNSLYVQQCTLKICGGKISRSYGLTGAADTFASHGSVIKARDKEAAFLSMSIHAGLGSMSFDGVTVYAAGIPVSQRNLPKDGLTALNNGVHVQGGLSQGDKLRYRLWSHDWMEISCRPVPFFIPQRRGYCASPYTAL